MEGSDAQNQENQSKKNSKEGYDKAILLIQNQVQLFWLIFGAFLLSETVLLGAITSIDANDTDNMKFWGSLFGLIICFLWWTTFRYNHAFYILRINEAKMFEPNEGEFFSNGLKLYEGEKVLGVIIPNYIRFFRPKRSLTILIGVFFIVFLILTVRSCPLFGNYC